MRLAVCVHAFYPEVFERIIERLSPSATLFTLFVTYPLEHEKEVLSALDKFEGRAHCLRVENLGMDVLPFITAVSHFNLTTYDVVLKIHTKNAKSRLGRAHLDIFQQHLWQNESVIKACLRAFENPDVFEVGPDILFRSTERMMYNNRRRFSSIATTLECDETLSENAGFFAGTMFYIRASSLTVLSQHRLAISEKFAESGNEAEQTGRDGSYAHVLERLFGALPHAEPRRYGLVYPTDMSMTEYLVREGLGETLISEPYRRLGGTDTLLKWLSMPAEVRTISETELFDDTYYQNQVGVLPRGMDPRLHYLLIGEPLGCNPSELFSTSYYMLDRPDVWRKGISCLWHFLIHGSKEKMPGNPSRDQWIALAVKTKLFDLDWYTVEHDFIKEHGITPIEHYQAVGSKTRMPTSPNFNPALIPCLDNVPLDEPIVTFMRSFMTDEMLSYDEIYRVIENNDFQYADISISRTIERYGITSALLGARAYIAVREGRLEVAERIMKNYWIAATANTLATRHRRSLMPSNQLGNAVFQQIERLQADKTVQVCVCVYTTLFGEIDDLTPIMSISEICDFVCFSDRPRESRGWRIHVVDPALGSNNLNAKVFKILPHHFFEGYDYTMFVDANTLFLGRIDEFILSYLISRKFVMFRHPERSDALAESISIVESLRHSPGAILNQLSSYVSEGLPVASGLLEASFIWRKCEEVAVDELMDLWWEHILRFSQRDQMSLAFLTWKTNVRPDVIPSEVGTSRSNSYFVKLPHSVPGFNKIKSSFEESDVWVLYGSRYTSTGSTVLRGQQIAELFEQTLHRRRQVFYSSFFNVSDKIVFLTKGFLLQHGVEVVELLRRNGNVVIVDYVDARPDPNVVALSHCVIASSLNGLYKLRQRFPSAYVHHLTHHVDSRLVGSSPHLQFAAGYFGEAVNTIRSAGIAKSVDFYQVSTNVQNIEWMSKIASYNFHYAVRKERSIDDAKPFLKGFVAAKFGANIIIQRGAGDADYYLGLGYPYLLQPDATVHQIEEMLLLAKDEFGSRRWEDGLAIMKEVRYRSSEEYIKNELEKLLDELGS